LAADVTNHQPWRNHVHRQTTCAGTSTRGRQSASSIPNHYSVPAPPLRAGHDVRHSLVSTQVLASDRCPIQSAPAAVEFARGIPAAAAGWVNRAWVLAAGELHGALEETAEADAPGLVRDELGQSRAHMIGLDDEPLPLARVVVLLPDAKAAINDPL